MSEDRWRYRRQGALAVLLLVGAGLLVARAAGMGQPVVNLSDEERRVLVREHWTERRVVERVEVEVPVEVERIVTRTERIEVQVPGRAVEVVRSVDVPRGTFCDPGPVELGGVGGIGCEVQRIEAGGEVFARALWSCRAAGPGWSAERGPEVMPDVRFESTAEPRPVLARLLELRAGAFLEPDQLGGTLGVGYFPARRRLGWWGDLSLALDPVRDVGDGDAAEDRVRLAGGVALRMGGP